MGDIFEHLKAAVAEAKPDTMPPAIYRLLIDAGDEIHELRATLSVVESEPDLNSAALAACREASERILGGNCAFVDDDFKLLAATAKRAVDAGLIDHLHPSIQAKLRPRATEPPNA